VGLREILEIRFHEIEALGFMLPHMSKNGRSELLK